MDWDEYKRRCDEPRVFSRWMLEQTRELLERAEANELASKIGSSLGGPPLPKPRDHKAGRATDMFELELEHPDARAVLRWMRHAIEQDWRSAGTRTRGLGGFAEAWLEYATWKEQHK